jgi:hypothetical protein
LSPPLSQANGNKETDSRIDLYKSFGVSASTDKQDPVYLTVSYRSIPMPATVRAPKDVGLMKAQLFNLDTGFVGYKVLAGVIQLFLQLS